MQSLCPEVKDLASQAIQSRAIPYIPPEHAANQPAHQLSSAATVDWCFHCNALYIFLSPAGNTKPSPPPSPGWSCQNSHNNNKKPPSLGVVVESFLHSPSGVKINILKRITTQFLLKLKPPTFCALLGKVLSSWLWGAKWGAEMKIFIVLFLGIMIEISTQSVQHAENEAYCPYNEVYFVF